MVLGTTLSFGNEFLNSAVKHLPQSHTPNLSQRSLLMMFLPDYKHKGRGAKPQRLILLFKHLTLRTNQVINSQNMESKMTQMNVDHLLHKNTVQHKMAGHLNLELAFWRDIIISVKPQKNSWL